MKFRRKAEPASVEESTTPVEDDRVAETPRIDLGSLQVPQVEGRELRVQVDEASGAVRSVVLANNEGAMEFAAFAAPRGGDLWGDVRPQIAQEVTSKGGQVKEREGRWGTELSCVMPVQQPDGTPAAQPSRVIGINGDRWMLRATLLGRPAVEPETAGDWEDALDQIVVRRGDVAMPVGEALPVTLPDDARRAR